MKKLVSLLLVLLLLTGLCACAAPSVEETIHGEWTYTTNVPSDPVLAIRFTRGEKEKSGTVIKTITQLNGEPDTRYMNVQRVYFDETGYPVMGKAIGYETDIPCPSGEESGVKDAE